MIQVFKNDITVDRGNELAPGATPVPGAGVHFKVWAPERKSVEVVMDEDGSTFALESQANGYHSALIREASTGTRYWYRLDGGEKRPDPVSRFQPDGCWGPSEVVDIHSFKWTDDDWEGAVMRGQAMYEMHVGTFTKEGTLRSAAQDFDRLKELGITVIELMPVSQFAGDFGWGYDGVFPYAPYNKYGRPEDLVGFIDLAHQAGIAVILDVVYNHLGPKGNVLPEFSPFYMSSTEQTDWGEGINFDGRNSGPVRDYFRENAVYWIRDYHFDGLRLDATQDIHDTTKPHIIVEIVEAVRRAAETREVIIIAENEPQQSFYLRPRCDGGYGLDGVWNDDFHHSAMVALTGQSEAYYFDYDGKPQEFISALKYGYLYQGQYYSWQKKSRGVSGLGIEPSAYVHFIQNHDQVANSARGLRVHELTDPGKLRAMTAVLLLGPAAPMLFQGQEYASSTPFLFFADHCEDLADSIRSGRRDFLKQWRSYSDPNLDKHLADPCDPETFQRCKLDRSEIALRQQWYELHSDLLRLRHNDPVLSRQGRWGVDGAVIGPECFVFRFFSTNYLSDRLLVVNFGTDLPLLKIPEPLVAPPREKVWQMLWSSEDPRYGGNGAASVLTEKGWRVPGHAAILLAAVEAFPIPANRAPDMEAKHS